LLDVVEALVIGGKLLCDVYEFHGSLQLSKAYQKAHSVSSA
jgi:hypothetical protein